MPKISEVFFSALLTVLLSSGSQSQEADDAAEFSQDDSSSLKGENVGGNFQGDMILSKQQIRNLNFTPRNGLINKRYRWPKNNEGNVIVPYGFKDKDEYCKFY